LETKPQIPPEKNPNAPLTLTVRKPIILHQTHLQETHAQGNYGTKRTGYKLKTKSLAKPTKIVLF
jgi:hypothetical protein